MIRKRLLDDVDSDNDIEKPIINPFAPSPLLTSAHKRQRITGPNAWDAQARHFSGSSHTQSDTSDDQDAVSAELGRGNALEPAAGGSRSSGVRVRLIQPVAGPSIPKTPSPSQSDAEDGDEDVESDNDGGDEDEDVQYDPDEVVIHSADDDSDAEEEDHGDTRSRSFSPSTSNQNRPIKPSKAPSVRPATPPLSSMNALLHNLHRAHRRQAPQFSSSPEREPTLRQTKSQPSSSNPTHLVPSSTHHVPTDYHRPNAFKPPSSPPGAPLSPSLRENEARRPFPQGDGQKSVSPRKDDAAKQDVEKAVVTARYEETNRLLGALFLSRRRQVNPEEEEL